MNRNLIGLIAEEIESHFALLLLVRAVNGGRVRHHIFGTHMQTQRFVSAFYSNALAVTSAVFTEIEVLRMAAVRHRSGAQPEFDFVTIQRVERVLARLFDVLVQCLERRVFR